MIGKITYADGRNYLCDDCNKKVGKFKSIKAAIAAGWAVSRDYTKCYCPTCAPFRRNVGKTGTRRKTVQLNTDDKTAG